MVKTEQPKGIVNCPKMLEGLGAANFHISLQNLFKYVEYVILSAFPRHPSRQAVLFCVFLRGCQL